MIAGRQETAVYLGKLKKFRKFPLMFDSPQEELCFLTSDLDLPHLTFEPLFRRFISHWTDGPTLDAFYFAMEALLVCSPTTRFTKDEERLITDFLTKCYIPSEGGFWTSPFGITASLYGTVCAIGVMKSLRGLKCGERPETPEEAQEFFSSFGKLGEQFHHDINKLLNSRVCPGKDAFFDSRQWDRECVLACSTAATILWNTGRDKEDLFGFVAHENLGDFLGKCLFMSPDPSAPWMAFKPHPDHYKPGLSVTYHALRLIHNCDLNVQTNKDHIGSYVQHCWTGEGFSPTIGESPSLLSTYYAVSCLEKEEYCGQRKDFIHFIRPSLQEFLNSCNHEGLYSAHPRLFPTAAATRYAAQIALEKSMIVGSFKQSETGEAIMEKLWDRRDGFFAYPVSLVKRVNKAHKIYPLLLSVVSSFTVPLSMLAMISKLLRIAWVHARTEE